ncbi:MAG: amidohydrolase [Caulobacter sp.]|nr:amidohydrolase [Caulobacter sp.]
MTPRLRAALAASATAVLMAACATTGMAGSPGGKPANAESGPAKPARAGLDPAARPDPFPSTYAALPSRPTAIRGATILTATGQQIDNGVIVMSGGKIVSVGGPDTPIPADVDVIDGRGKWVTPGVIDAHSHLGVYPSPSVGARSDGNEATDPNTAYVWAEHSIWPQDPGFNRARAGGVTTLMILPGSANLFGGRSVTVRNLPSVTMQGMKFPGAPYGVKMACGENPKRVYGSKSRTPATAMGNVAGYRRAWIDAADYARRWDDYRAKVEKGEKADAPKRDLTLDTLSGVLRGEILVQNHCYRADEMAVMIDIAREFGYRITMFHHASEAYKLGAVLAKEDICFATWADWQGFKMESLDGIEANAAIAYKAGACTVIHSDDETMTQRLNQEAALAMAAGNRIGFGITRAEAIAWITANPAKALGIADQTGSLESGKRADVVIWSADPFSVYALAERVYLDGAVVYDRKDPRYQPRSDFELGRPGEGAFH